MNLYDKEARARAKFIGKKVRWKFRGGRFRTCINVIAYGQPSGWFCTYQLKLAGGGELLTDTFNRVEIKPESKPK